MVWLIAIQCQLVRTSPMEPEWILSAPNICIQITGGQGQKSQKGMGFPLLLLKVQNQAIRFFLYRGIMKILAKNERGDDKSFNKTYSLVPNVTTGWFIWNFFTKNVFCMKPFLPIGCYNWLQTNQIPLMWRWRKILCHRKMFEMFKYLVFVFLTHVDCNSYISHFFKFHETESIFIPS